VALGLTNSNELVPGSGFPGDIWEAGIDPAISASGSRRGWQTRASGGGVLEVRFSHHALHIYPKIKCIVARKYVIATVSNTDTPTGGSQVAFPLPLNFKFTAVCVSIDRFL